MFRNIHHNIIYNVCLQYMTINPKLMMNNYDDLRKDGCIPCHLFILDGVNKAHK